MISSNPDAGIPLLTEIITPSEKTEAAIEQNQRTQEVELSARIFHQVWERFDPIIEKRIDASLAAVSASLIASLALEIKRDLRHTLRDIVLKAVTEEMAQGDMAAAIKK